MQILLKCNLTIQYITLLSSSHWLKPQKLISDNEVTYFELSLWHCVGRVNCFYMFPPNKIIKIPLILINLNIYIFFRFTVDVCVCTTQLERTVRGVRTFIMTPPGGLEEKMQLTSAGVNKIKSLWPLSLSVWSLKPDVIVFVTVGH